MNLVKNREQIEFFFPLFSNSRFFLTVLRIIFQFKTVDLAALLFEEFKNFWDNKEVVMTCLVWFETIFQVSSLYTSCPKFYKSPWNFC